MRALDWGIAVCVGVASAGMVAFFVLWVLA